jgi:hypothetical protein
MMMISLRVTRTNRNSSSQKGGHDEGDENGVGREWVGKHRTRGVNNALSNRKPPAEPQLLSSCPHIKKVPYSLGNVMSKWTQCK